MSDKIPRPVSKELMPLFIMIVLTAIAFIVIIGKGSYDLATTKDLGDTVEWRNITILKIEEPKHFRLSYQFADTNEVVEDGRKHCGYFSSSKFQVGKIYQVKILYKWTQREGEPVKKYRVTDGCDFYNQPTVEITNDDV